MSECHSGRLSFLSRCRSHLSSSLQAPRSGARTFLTNRLRGQTPAGLLKSVNTQSSCRRSNPPAPILLTVPDEATREDVTAQQRTLLIGPHPERDLQMHCRSYCKTKKSASKHESRSASALVRSYWAGRALQLCVIGCGSRVQISWKTK